MATTSWRIKSDQLEEREKDFSADFILTNIDTGRQVTITLQQNKGDPASDLIGACRALAQLLENVSSRDDPETNTGRLN
jgi:hypothetical protein